MNTFPAPGPKNTVARREGITFDFSCLPASLRPLVDVPPAAPCELCVAIPVHNEEAGIVATLAALAAQTDACGRPLNPERYEILVLANNCTDATVARARGFAATHPRLRLHVIEVLLAGAHAHVGAARRLVMDEAGAPVAIAGPPARGHRHDGRRHRRAAELGRHEPARDRPWRGRRRRAHRFHGAGG